MNQLPWSVILPNQKCGPFQSASAQNLKNADEKKCDKVVNNILAGECFHLDAPD